MKDPPQAFTFSFPPFIPHSAHALLFSESTSALFFVYTEGMMNGAVASVINLSVFPFYTVRSQEDLWSGWRALIQQVEALRHTSPPSLADETTGSIIKYSPVLNDEEPGALHHCHSEPFSAQYIIQLCGIIYEWFFHQSSSSAPQWWWWLIYCLCLF